MKTTESSILSIRPVTEIKEMSEVSKSYNMLPRKLSPFESIKKSETDGTYLSSEELLPVKHPHEALQRAMNRADD